MTCRKSVTLLDAFLDGELPQEQMLAFEEHLGDCDTCQERADFDSGLRSSLRRSVRDAAVVTDGFEARLAGALRAERERVLDVTSPSVRPVPFTSPSPAPSRRWPGLAPLSLAALATMGVVLWGNNRDAMSERARVDVPPPAPAPAVENPESVLDQLIDFHASPPEPQVTEARLLDRLEPEVGMPLRLPEMRQFGAAWEGGSVVPMRNQRAAVFRYRLSNHPVSVYVYDARRVPLRAFLEPRVVRNTPVHVGERRGYSIVAREQRGVGYAVATDLNDVESAEIVTTMY